MRLSWRRILLWAACEFMVLLAAIYLFLMNWRSR